MLLEVLRCFVPRRGASGNEGGRHCGAQPNHHIYTAQQSFSLAQDQGLDVVNHEGVAGRQLSDISREFPPFCFQMVKLLVVPRALGSVPPGVVHWNMLACWAASPEPRRTLFERVKYFTVSQGMLLWDNGHHACARLFESVTVRRILVMQLIVRLLCVRAG